MQTESITTLPQALAVSARRFPETAAIVDNDKRISYRDLDARVARVAGAFVRAGIAKGDRVALWAPNRAEWIVACLGAQAAGAVVVTLNTRLKGVEAQYILNKSRAKVLVCVAKFLNVDYPALLAGLELPHLERIVTIDGDWESFADSATAADIEKAAAVRAALRPEDPCDILFTSGTTGQPKGVVYAHGQSIQLYQVWADYTGVTHGDRYLVVNPFFHSFGYKAGVIVCLLKGATIYPQLTLDVPDVIRKIQTERITVMPGPPTLFQSLLNAPEFKGADLTSLRLATTGASVVPPSLIERMRSEIGIDNVLTAYGLTECGGTATISKPSDNAERVATTVGYAIPGIELACVDANGKPVPTGEQGEVVVRGYNVMQGYFEDPEATSEAIDRDGWLHTGDVGRLDAEGYLQITDRMKDMFITGGFNCYPAEIERILATCPEIAQVAIVGVPDERMGEVGKAYVVPRAGTRPTPESIIAWSRQSMANYKVPRQVEIVDQLPLNASGKVQKFRLRDGG